jgi:hypothetical protein
MHHYSSAKLKRLKQAFLADRPDDATWQLCHVSLIAQSALLSGQASHSKPCPQSVSCHETSDRTDPGSEFICPDP